jgi:hypothetical protein
VASVSVSLRNPNGHENSDQLPGLKDESFGFGRSPAKKNLVGVSVAQQSEEPIA